MNITSASCTAPESNVSTPQEACSIQLYILDELCRLATKLDAISSSVRLAIVRNEVSLDSLRQEFDATRDEIIANVQRLAVHRLMHFRQVGA